MSSFLGVLFDGVSYGCLLFVISIGLSVTMGLMNFINLAHGAFAMVGGYVCVAAVPARADPCARHRPWRVPAVPGRAGHDHYGRVAPAARQDALRRPGTR